MEGIYEMDIKNNLVSNQLDFKYPYCISYIFTCHRNNNTVFANAYVCRCWDRIIVSKGFFNRHRSIDIRFLVKPIRNIDGWGSNYSFYERNKRENKLSLNQTTD